MSFGLTDRDNRNATCIVDQGGQPERGVRMDQPITRKFYKPVKGSGELRKDEEHFASVRFYLQGWRDFMTREEAAAQGDRLEKLSGMEGEITLSVEDRRRLSVEQVLNQEFHLHTNQDDEYTLTAYKLKDDSPGKGRYSVRCKLDS